MDIRWIFSRPPKPMNHVNGFDWDEGNRDKCQKHGVPLVIIEAAFSRPIDILPDLKHSNHEMRFLAIGKTEEGRGVFICFTLRRQDRNVLIRPISARFMNAKEVAYYDQTPAHPDDR